MADHLVNDDYMSFGYDTIILDDCWMAKDRDQDGRLYGDPERFPSGMKALGEYFHSLGLKYGIYADFGSQTCAGFPGTQGYLKTDALTFAEWEVDYVKLDGCYSTEEEQNSGYPEFGTELNQTGRPIVYSCSWPAYQKNPNYQDISRTCNLWRNFVDIDDSWNSVKSIMNHYAELQDTLVPVAGPGHWNDPDMLVIGNFGCSEEQSRTQMAIWAILAAPLIMSNDLRSMSPRMKEILTNREVIAVNQDPSGIQGKRVITVSSVEIWVRPVNPVVDKEWSYAVGFHSNEIGGPGVLLYSTPGQFGLNSSFGYLIRDLHQHENCGFVHKDDSLAIEIVPTGTRLLKFTAVSDDFETKMNSIPGGVSNSCSSLKIAAFSASNSSSPKPIFTVSTTEPPKKATHATQNTGNTGNTWNTGNSWNVPPLRPPPRRKLTILKIIKYLCSKLIFTRIMNIC